MGVEFKGDITALEYSWEKCLLSLRDYDKR